MSLISTGKPEPVLTTGTNYTDVWYDNQAEHWTLPIDRLALAQLVNLNAQHGGVLYARRNMVTANYENGGLTHEQLGAAVFDWLTFGDVAILKVRNGWGGMWWRCIRCQRCIPASVKQANSSYCNRLNR